MCFVKRKLKFKDYKIRLKTFQIKNIINSLEKKETDAGSLKEIAKYKNVI